MTVPNSPLHEVLPSPPTPPLPLPSPSLIRYVFHDGVWPQVSALLEDWDRSIGTARPKKSPSEVESLDQQRHTPSTPKHKGGKGKKEVSTHTLHTHTHMDMHAHMLLHNWPYSNVCSEV